jgi:hypothetical protein
VATEDKPPEEAGKGDKNPLPIAEPVSTQPTIKPVEPVEAAAPEGELPAPPAQPQPTGEPAPISEPLLIRVLDEPSRFERMTIRYGKIGVLVAFLALVAASVTGFFIYQQFTAMDEANVMAGISARRARYDARASEITTAQQLVDLQAQLAIAHNTFDALNRPYVGVEGIFPAYENQTGLVTNRKLATSMKVSTHVKNFGPVAGTEFSLFERAFIDGKKITQTPGRIQITIYPTQEVGQEVVIGFRDYPNIISKSSVLVLEITIQYTGPSGTYTECDAQKYEPDVGSFTLSGHCKGN